MADSAEHSPPQPLPQRLPPTKARCPSKTRSSRPCPHRWAPSQSRCSPAGTSPKSQNISKDACASHKPRKKPSTHISTLRNVSCLSTHPLFKDPAPQIRTVAPFRRKRKPPPKVAMPGSWRESADEHVPRSCDCQTAQQQRPHLHITPPQRSSNYNMSRNSPPRKRHLFCDSLSGSPTEYSIPMRMHNNAIHDGQLRRLCSKHHTT